MCPHTAIYVSSHCYMCDLMTRLNDLMTSRPRRLHPRQDKAKAQSLFGDDWYSIYLLYCYKRTNTDAATPGTSFSRARASGTGRLT